MIPSLFAQSSQRSADPGPGELIIQVLHRVIKTIKVEAVGTVWGSKDEGYPVTHEFDFWQKTDMGFWLQFVDDPGTGNPPIIGYGKYKITIDGNSGTTIRYQLPQPGFVRLKIFNLMGHEVKTLQEVEKQAGEYSVVWDARDDLGRDVSSGIYIYKLTVEPVSGNGKRFEESRKLMLVR